jgi:hypothetical protein
MRNVILALPSPRPFEARSTCPITIHYDYKAEAKVDSWRIYCFCSPRSRPSQSPIHDSSERNVFVAPLRVVHSCSLVMLGLLQFIFNLFHQQVQSWEGKKVEDARLAVW